MKYRNVIFDLGNVLVALDNEACARALTAIGCERLVRVNDDPAVRRLFDQLGLGLISNVQFYAQVRRLTGTTATDAQIDTACNAMLTVIPDVKKQRLLDLRRAGCHTFLLSNTIDIHWRYCVEHLFPYNGYGVPDYFDRALQTGIDPHHTLFIDDLQENCDAAAQLGIDVYCNAHFNDWLSLEL